MNRILAKEMERGIQVALDHMKAARLTTTLLQNATAAGAVAGNNLLSLIAQCAAAHDAALKTAEELVPLFSAQTPPVLSAAAPNARAKVEVAKNLAAQLSVAVPDGGLPPPALLINCGMRTRRR